MRKGRGGMADLPEKFNLKQMKSFLRNKK